MVSAAHSNLNYTQEKITMATINVYRNKLKAAARFMAVQDIRYYLNGLLIESNDVQTRIVATDGHTMFIGYDDAKGDNAGSFAGIVPDTAIKQILAWKAPYKSANDAPVVLTTSDDPLGEHRAEWCGHVCVFRTIRGQFPDYTRVVPETLSGLAGHYNPDYLARAKAAAVDLGSPKQYGINLTQNGDRAAIVTFSAQAFAIIMPMRGESGDLGAAEWARTKLMEQPDYAALHAE
jgi:DNA polymerase-3 subunit beta